MTMTPTTPQDGCAILKQGIISIRQEIKLKKDRIDALTTELNKLLCQPNPDPVRVEALRRDIRDLSAELETDRAQLNAFEEEFSASCGPVPAPSHH